jgi:hypothetical protein
MGSLYSVWSPGLYEVFSTHRACMTRQAEFRARAIKLPSNAQTTDLLGHEVQPCKFSSSPALQSSGPVHSGMLPIIPINAADWTNRPTSEWSTNWTESKQAWRCQRAPLYSRRDREGSNLAGTLCPRPATFTSPTRYEPDSVSAQRPQLLQHATHIFHAEQTHGVFLP